MIHEIELKPLVEVYKYLQLCKNLRQPTWQKQIHEYHKKIGRHLLQIDYLINLLQTWESPIIPNQAYALHPEFQVLMAINGMVKIQDNRNYLPPEQQLDLDWFYLSLLQRWLKKHTDSKLVKNIATKHQSHVEIIDQLIDKIMNSNQSETLLLKFSLPLKNKEISNTNIDGAWVHLNNSLKSVFSNLKTTYPDIQVSFIKKLSLNSTEPKLCGCLHITHFKLTKKNLIISSLDKNGIFSDRVDYIPSTPLTSKAEFFTDINPSFAIDLRERTEKWKKVNQQIKNMNAIYKDDLRKALFKILNPHEELIVQVNLNGPLIDQRHKKRFFSSSLVKEK